MNGNLSYCFQVQQATKFRSHKHNYQSKVVPPRFLRKQLESNIVNNNSGMSLLISVSLSLMLPNILSLSLSHFYGIFKAKEYKFSLFFFLGSKLFANNFSGCFYCQNCLFLLIFALGTDFWLPSTKIPIKGRNLVVFDIETYMGILSIILFHFFVKTNVNTCHNDLQPLLLAKFK